MRTCSRMRGSSCRARASGVEREPGATTASRTPRRDSSSAKTRASAVAGFIGRSPPAPYIGVRSTREELRSGGQEGRRRRAGGRAAGRVSGPAGEAVELRTPLLLERIPPLLSLLAHVIKHRRVPGELLHPRRTITDRVDRPLD